MAIRKRNGTTNGGDGHVFDTYPDGHVLDRKVADWAEFFGHAILHVMHFTGITAAEIIERIGVEEFQEKHLLKVISGEKVIYSREFKLLATALSLLPSPEEPASERKQDFRIFESINFVSTQNGINSIATTVSEDVYSARAAELKDNPLPSLFPENRHDMETARKEFFRAVVNTAQEKKDALEWLKPLKKQIPKGKAVLIGKILPVISEQTAIHIWELEGLRTARLFYQSSPVIGKENGKLIRANNITFNDPGANIADLFELEGNERRDFIKTANAFFTRSLHLPPLQAQREGTKQDFLELLRILNPNRGAIAEKFAHFPRLKAIKENHLNAIFDRYAITSQIEQATLREASIAHNNKTPAGIAENARNGHQSLGTFLRSLRTTHVITEEDPPRVVPREEARYLTASKMHIAGGNGHLCSTVGTFQGAISLHENNKMRPTEEHIKGYVAFYNLQSEKKTELLRLWFRDVIYTRENILSDAHNGELAFHEMLDLLLKTHVIRKDGQLPALPIEKVVDLDVDKITLENQILLSTINVSANSNISYHRRGKKIPSIESTKGYADFFGLEGEDRKIFFTLREEAKKARQESTGAKLSEKAGKQDRNQDGKFTETETARRDKKKDTSPEGPAP